MNPTLHIQLLDGLHLRLDDSPITSVDTPRLQKLLAYLVLHRAVPSSRQQLAFLLWPDTTDTQAQSNLRTLLHRLRQALPHADDYLHATTQTVQWRPDSSFTLDVADFERARAQAKLAEQEGDHTTFRGWLTNAVAIYRGDLLPNWYDDWVLDEREPLRQQFHVALERLILLLEWERDYRTAIDYTQRLLQHDPLHEAAYCQLMRLHALHGDRTAALRVYHTCSTILMQEFGVEPGPETRHAYEGYKSYLAIFLLCPT